MADALKTCVSSEESKPLDISPTKQLTNLKVGIFTFFGINSPFRFPPLNLSSTKNH